MEHVDLAYQDQKPRTADDHPRPLVSSAEYRGAGSRTARVVLWYEQT